MSNFLISLPQSYNRAATNSTLITFMTARVLVFGRQLAWDAVASLVQLLGEVQFSLP